jgi:hypothetical protein
LARRKVVTARGLERERLGEAQMHRTRSAEGDCAGANCQGLSDIGRYVR